MDSLNLIFFHKTCVSSHELERFLRLTVRNICEPLTKNPAVGEMQKPLSNVNLNYISHWRPEGYRLDFRQGGEVFTFIQQLRQNLILQYTTNKKIRITLNFRAVSNSKLIYVLL